MAANESDPRPEAERQLEPKEEFIERDKWNSKLEYVLSMVGYGVGIGNLWRFPFLVHKFGSAFIVPYAVFLIVFGLPLVYLETSLGQYSRSSVIRVWRCAPLFTGVGFSVAMLATLTNVHYNVRVSYSLVYFAYSLGPSIWGANQGKLPWTECSPSKLWCNDTGSGNGTKSPAELFWFNFVLEAKAPSSSPLEVGALSTSLTLSLFLCWLVAFVCTSKGIKSSGTAVFYTVPFTYVIILALLVQSVLRPGAEIGIRQLLYPDWSVLLRFNSDLWLSALGQVFWSLGTTYGGLIMLGSYNNFKNHVHRDAVVFCFCDFATSLLATVIVFSIIGALAAELNVSFVEAMTNQEGVPYIAYSDGLSHFPYAGVWSALFFLLFFLIGLDTVFQAQETLLSVFKDFFMKARKRQTLMAAVASALMFAASLPLLTRRGHHLTGVLDACGEWASIVIGLFEVLGFCWVYGAGNVSGNTKEMEGDNKGRFGELFYYLTWLIAPVGMAALLVVTTVLNKISSAYEEDNKVALSDFEEWSKNLKWTLFGIVIAPIFVWAVGFAIRLAMRRKLRRLFRPSPQWGPPEERHEEDDVNETRL